MEGDTNKEVLWNFIDYELFNELQERLDKANVSSSLQSSTVSYFLVNENSLALKSYELHASYSGRTLDNGTPEVEKTYLRNVYKLFKVDETDQWKADTLREEISEKDFYSMVLYANPKRVINLQQLSFRLNGSEYLVELNMENKTLVLINIEGKAKIPNMIADMIDNEEIDRTSYIMRLLKNEKEAFSDTDMSVRH